METFLRKANETEYVAAPCDFVACEPGGEPCSTHERLMAHAEGDHELCEPGCGTTAAVLPQPETQAGHCGRTKSVCDTEYPPCGRPAGHEEAYCHSADGNGYFLATAPAVVSQPDEEATR